MRLSVILPAHDEGHHISANVGRVCAALEGESFEVLVVDDGSLDDTYQQARLAAADGLPVRVLCQERNLGKGAALFRGFADSRGELVAFLDSDLEIGPENVRRLVGALESSGADVVIGSKAGGSSGFPLRRRLLSRVFRAAVSFLFGLSVGDTQTGIKLFRREVLERVAPRMSTSRFAFDIELLVAASRFGYTVAECPVPASFGRERRMGRISLRSMLETLADVLRIYYRASFWSWLHPGLLARLWMVAFVLGVFLFGVGVAKILTPIVLHPPLRDVFHVVALQFLPPVLRDWLVLIGGALIVVVSLVQLNRILLAAFARRDRAGLAGLLK
jgi:glycosyltransferase involved in cell wall biosynthesis